VRASHGLKTGWENGFLQTLDVAKVSACLLDTLSESLLTLTHPNTGVVVLIQRCQPVSTTIMAGKSHFLVGLVGTLGITYLCQKIILLFQDEVLREVNQQGFDLRVKEKSIPARQRGKRTEYQCRRSS